MALIIGPLYSLVVFSTYYHFWVIALVAVIILVQYIIVIITLPENGNETKRQKDVNLLYLWDKTSPCSDVTLRQGNYFFDALFNTWRNIFFSPC